eukprot:3505973-Pyramimonas_sp.AAC.1
MCCRIGDAARSSDRIYPARTLSRRPLGSTVRSFRLRRSRVRSVGSVPSAAAPLCPSFVFARSVFLNPLGHNPPYASPSHPITWHVPPDP